MTEALSSLGWLHTNGPDAADFVQAWHGDAPYDWLIAVNMMAAHAKMIKTVAAPWTTIRDTLREGDLDDLAYLDGQRWNLYHSAGFLLKVPDRGRRSGKTNVRGVPGVWLDLDVKDGAFTSEVDALDFLQTLPVAPTIMVATGTGGVQGYWKTDKILEPGEAEELCVRWWRFACTLTDRAIDKVQNRDRIMRLPGSVRWPKETESPALARLLDTGGPVVTADTLRSLTEEVAQRAETERQRHRDELGESRHRAALHVKQNMTRWELLDAIQFLEEEFNSRYSWASILEPMGWTQLGEDYDGRTLWCRPGGDRKSAATDYVGPDGVVSEAMSLFSDAEQTGLRRLADAEVPLTKYRVYVELYWRGDEEGFVSSWIEQLRKEGQVQ